MKRTLSLLLALVFALSLTGCGSQEAPETTAAAQTETVAAPALGLVGWTMDATTWSSPNGATINLIATPIGYTEGYGANFIVRLEGEEIANVPCQWDGSNYTASAELNAEDGYCYYLFMTAADGTTLEIPVNTPNEPKDETLIDLASSLNAYCSVTVNTSELKEDKLVVTDGAAQVQLPRITTTEGTVTCTQAVMVLSYNGSDVSLEKVAIGEADETRLCHADLKGLSFSVPAGIEDDHQLSLRLEVTLSNQQILTVPAGTWFYLDGNLLLAVG